MRTHLFALACFGLATGCASSSSNQTVQNPDAGNVQYDVGGDPAATPADGSPAAEGGPQGHARDTTGVRGVGTKRPGVAKLKAAKPPRPEVKVAKIKPGAIGKGGTATPASPNGLQAEVFALDAGTSALPDFAELTASNTLIVNDLNVEARGAFPGVSQAGEVIGMRFTGSLNVTEDGEYRLCLNSSAGSRLSLDDTPVVDNDGDHGATEVCEAVFMAPGEYGLQIDYFYKANDSVVLQFKWARAGGDPIAVPTGSLFKPGT
ncbi:MAG: PA14 domain-containing protein [Nannocystaceae bacterium]|nr:hypothetical protein [Myxococcales bacterium]